MGEVVDIFSRSRNRSTVVADQGSLQDPPATPGESQNVDFSELARRNAANQERLRKERAQANQNVLKSYRIK